jgi:hypothetical protein
MAHLENEGALSREQLTERIGKMSDAELQAQEIAQKAAVHAIKTLQGFGVTEAAAAAMLESLSSLAVVVTAEVERRNLTVVDIDVDGVDPDIVRRARGPVVICPGTLNPCNRKCTAICSRRRLQ